MARTLRVTKMTFSGRRARRVELHRPEKRNCLSVAMLEDLISELRAAPDEVLLLSGHGPAFCTGLDLREIYAAGSARGHLSLLIDLFEALAAYSAPTVSLVDAPAHGGGVGLAFCTNITVASPDARFALPSDAAYLPLVEVLFPAIAARRLVDRAMLASLVGRDLAAAEAERIGLVQCLTDDNLTRAAEIRLNGEPVPLAAWSDEVRSELATLHAAATTSTATSGLISRLRQRYG